MKNKNPNFSLSGQRLYPYLKLTRERFPRLLVTRCIENDDAEYFGAFLPETGVRFLVDFLNKTFRLRACEIDVNGSFNVPCTQFYRRRCVAPCVANLCGDEKYNERVSLVRLFLERNIGALEKKYFAKIEALAENFNYERAARVRDEWLEIEKILSGKEWNFWLDDAVDTFEIEETADDFIIFLVTMRGRKTLGKRAFVFEKTGTREEIMPAILPEIYRFHAPKEIRVSDDFAKRFAFADDLSKKFGRKIKITLVKKDQPKVLTNRALSRTKYEHEFGRIGAAKSAPEIQNDLKKIFKLARRPRRIEAFDVAHISGSDFTAAKAVWKNGRFAGKDYEFWFSDEASELETMRKFIEFRFSRPEISENAAENVPDLVLIDGGRAHLQAALKGLENVRRDFTLIAAVKPPQKHGEIAHFLTESGAKIEFDGASDAHRILQTLRDEAHDLSNEIHRQRREMAHFYELAAMLPSLAENERRALLKTAGSLKNVLETGEAELLESFSPATVQKVLKDLNDYRTGRAPRVEPLVVPLRFADENGDAADLARPLANYRAR